MNAPQPLQEKKGWHWFIDTGKNWANRVLFPEFSNKITWYVVITGCALIVTPDSLQFLITDWVTSTLSLSVGQQLTIADFATSNADYWTGFGLVAIALLHNLGFKWITLQLSQATVGDQQKRDESDLALYKELTALLPSGSGSIRMLIEHDFGHSFNTESLDALDEFVEEWACPERMFHHPELEAARKSMWDCAAAFTSLLGKKSCLTSAGRQSVVADEYRQEFNWPKWVDSDVRAVNEAATKAYRAHQEFITIGKKLLKC